MDNMSLIVFEKTGHVLGAFTRTADPEGTVTAEDVVGDGLALRDPDTGDDLVSVQPQHLTVQTIDRRDDVIVSHRSYVLEDGVATERSALAAATALQYGGSTLTLTLPNAPSEDIEAWVQIEDDQSQPVVLSVEIFSSGTQGTASLTLTPGDYGVLVLVPGYRALVGSLTVT